MNEPIDTTAVAVRDNTNMAVGRPMDVNDIIGQVKLIQEVMTKVMQEGEHYGTIPGCGNRKTLLQPGAQKLTMTFRLAPEYQIQETNFDRGHKEYRVICTLRSIQGGAFVGQGVGCCSTLESKYRWKGGARKCPECGKETIIKGKAEYGGGWLCFAKKGGCGQKWEDGAKEIEGQSVEKVEHDSPADFYNTVLKMAKKRAFVDATITATAASDIFTQDVGDAEGEEAPEEPRKSPQEAPKASPRPQPAKAAKTPAKATPSAAKANSEEQWGSFLVACKTKLLSMVSREIEWAWWAYAVENGWILSAGESLADAPAEKIFEGYDRKNFKESIAGIFERHTQTVADWASSCAPQMRDEMMAALVPMPLGEPAPAKKAGAANPTSLGICPACKGTAIKPHEELLATNWCQKCGTMWDKDGVYEEHAWMKERLPFAPKDEDKKQFKGMTLGQISRLDSKYWFGVVKNFEAKPWNGKPASAESVAFAKACEAARAHLDKQNEQPEQEPDEQGKPDPTDDVPF